MAETKKKADVNEGAQKSDVSAADLGPPTPASMMRLAEDLPEKDPVQDAFKRQLTAESAQQEVKEKVKIVNASPDAAETPSGHALIEVAGIANDTKRGEEYARLKSARRWGYESAGKS